MIDTPQQLVFALAAPLALAWTWLAVSTFWGALRAQLPIRARPHHVVASLTQIVGCLTLCWIAASGHMTTAAADVWPAFLGLQFVSLVAIVIETRRRRRGD